MPLYEYQCKKCGASFEVLVRSDTKVQCAECGSTKVEKQFSTFAAQSGSSGPELPPCHSGGPGCDLGKCGSGRCGLA